MVRKDGFWAMRNNLIFNFSNLTDSLVGEHGVPDSLLDSMCEKAEAADAYIQNRYDAGELPFRDLPYIDVKGINEYAAGVCGKFENFVNVGIGGSALGAQALFMALCHPYHNHLERRHADGLKMFFADNIDPDHLKGIFDVCDPKKTIYNIITKSGSTAETMGSFLLVKAALEKSVGTSWRDHIVICCAGQCRRPLFGVHTGWASSCRMCGNRYQGTP